MGTTTPNIGLYIPADGETNYGTAFANGMLNLDTHDHSGSPSNGVPISAAGLANGSVTADKLNSNVLVVGGGLSFDGSNAIQTAGLLNALFNLGSNGIIVRTSSSAVQARTITGTANQIAVTNGNGVSGNPTLSFPANTLNVNQAAFLANADVQSNVTGDGTNFVPVFTLATTGPTIPPLFNQGGYFNGSGTFTPPVTGVYIVHTDLSLTGLDAAHTTGEIKLFINSNAVYSDFNGNVGAVRNAGNGLVLSLNQICYLTAGDTVKVQLTISGGAKVVSIADGTFAAVLLC